MAVSPKSPLSRRRLLREVAPGAAAMVAAAPFSFAGRRGPTAAGSDQVAAARITARMETIARFGATPAGGGSRTGGSDADLAARAAFAGWLEDAGLTVRIDFAGNLIGRLEGSEPALPPLVSGSHLDSVPDGGNFDGVAGSIAALEAAEVFQSGAPLCHPLEVVVFFNEENGKTGSRALAGEVTPEELDLPLHGGFSMGEALARVGGSPERITEAPLSPGDVAGYLELHIEQGPVLDTEGIEIGAVEGIVGIRRFRVTVSGFANHAGTTAMAIRRDALVTAGRFIAAVSDETNRWPGRQVATVGRIEAEPGAANVIPGEVELSLEIRDLRMETIDALYDHLRQAGSEIAARNQTTMRFEPYYLSRAAPCDTAYVDLVAATADDLGCSVARLPSGAGHDAQSMAPLAPIGMIFVPSRDGISHSPREFTPMEDIVRGAQALTAALRRLDGVAG